MPSSDFPDDNASPTGLPPSAIKAGATAASGGDKLFAYVGKAIERNKATILPILKEKTGEISLAALRNDRVIEKLAGALYGRLPLMVRLALREQAFIEFMLENRNRILARFVAEPDGK